MWINCSFNFVGATHNRSAIIGDRIFAGVERDFDALDVKTGAKLWTTRVDERITDLCLGPDGTLRVGLQDGETYVVEQETGKLTPSTRTNECQVIWDDWHGEEGAPGQHFSHRSATLPSVDGMVSARLIAHGDRTIVLGYEKPGSHVPMAAGVDNKGKLLWKRELPPEDPGLADTNEPSHATLDDHRLCATYGVKQGIRLGCWDPTTGATLWDSPVTVVDDARYVDNLVLTDRNVILLHTDRKSPALGVFDLATGAWLYDIR
jgi:outer membrane protein assembly factor BamB